MGIVGSMPGIRAAGLVRAQATASSLRRVIAMLMLPLSIAPVLLLGPSVLRAPMTLAREVEGSLRQINPFAVQAAFASGAGGGLEYAHASAKGGVSNTKGGPSNTKGEPLVKNRGSSVKKAKGGRCAGRAPRALRARRLGGPKVRVRLSWRAPTHGRPATYRVLRTGRTVGQTRGRSMVVNVWAGRRTTLTVQARYAHAPSVCATSMKELVRRPGPHAHRRAAAPNDAPPSVPAGLSVSEVSDAGATLWWLPSTPGGARIAGYRVYRDGKALGQTSQTTMRLQRLSTLHSYSLQVSAVDAAKHESAHSASLNLSTSHTPPAGPTEISALSVTDTSATLSWRAGSATSGRIVGYLLYQDGQPERLVHGQQVTVTLASQRHYTFTVRAVDSYDYLSAPAPDVAVFTTHTPPSMPANLTATEVSASSAKLSWSSSTPASGRIIGYRVFRDDIPVGQTSSTEMTVASLAPSSEYQFTVTAVDSLGAISPRTSPLTVRTEDPTPTHGNVQAFLLASTDQSFADLQAHYQQIGVVYPTYFDCNVQGGLSGRDDPLVTGWAQARQIAVMPRVNCQNPKDENEILNEPTARNAMIEGLAALAREHGYAGFQIDFEGAQPTERGPFTAFITALAARLHAQGEKLSTVVTAKYYNIMSGRAAMYDDAALSYVSDYLFVLDWGLHWQTSAPGPIDELAWFTRVAEYTATLPNRERFVLGMPMYGIDWPGAGGASNPGTPLEYSNTMAESTVFGALSEWEPVAADPHFSYVDSAGVHHSVWYTDQQSIGLRVALARRLGLGVGLWHLGSEDQGVWSLPGVE
jgi:spore germination protein YaaH